MIDVNAIEPEIVDEDVVVVRRDCCPVSMRCLLVGNWTVPLIVELRNSLAQLACLVDVK